MEIKSDIDKILAEKARIEEVINTQFKKKVTVMFTDIKGSTSFYEKYGDIEGRAMVHRHNEIVLPAIDACRGRLIKTIGDATMSLYQDPGDGVRASVEIQKRLMTHNSGKGEKDRLSVRVGIHYGDGIVDDKDVFGDVVNTASRIESKADGGEIMISEELYREVKSTDEFIFRYHDAVAAKGKKEPVKIYKVLWHDEHLHLGKTRHGGQAARTRRREGMFVLEASLSDQKLKVCGYQRSGEEQAVKSYDDVKYNGEKVQEYTKGIIDLLNRANRRGKIGNDILVKLKEYGRLLYDELVPVKIREGLAKTAERNLMLNIDDNLVHVPWELLFDGKDFLCQRFSMGRTVNTRQAVSTIARAVGRPLKIQVLADARGDLPASYTEGVIIKDEIGKTDDLVDVTLKTTEVGTDYVKSKIRSFDIVHYAGHAEHIAGSPEESGWLLKDGKLRAADVMNMTGGVPMPSLVFSNACQSGQTDAWKLAEDCEARIFGLANAFLLAGVQHYIGTFWEIPDEAGANFAIQFYRNLVHGVSVGEALRRARQSLIEKYGEDTIVWAGYMLYGDPTTTYLDHDIAEPELEATAAEPQVAAAAGLRAGGPEVVHFPAGSPSKSSKTALIAAGVAALMIAGAAAAYIAGGSKGAGPSGASAPVAGSAAAPSAASDAESRKRVDELVASLAADYRAGKINRSAASTDDWTSRPVTLVFMDIKAEGAGGEGTVKKLVNRLTQALQEDGSVQLVEREVLEKLLSELKLSASDLADPATALKLGKLLSARIMVTGSLVPEKKGMTAMLRFIDTETSAVRKVINEDAPNQDVDKEFTQALAKTISAWVRADFPVQGRVASLAGDSCIVNIGQAQGLKQGDKMDILQEAKKGTGLFAPIGQLEIGQVAKDKAEAKIIAKSGTIKEGAQVRKKI